MSSDKLLRRALGAFATAGSERDYSAAKKLGSRLPKKVQLLVVDAAINARRRLEDLGVLLTVVVATW